MVKPQKVQVSFVKQLLRRFLYKWGYLESVPSPYIQRVCLHFRNQTSQTVELQASSIQNPKHESSLALMMTNWRDIAYIPILWRKLLFSRDGSASERCADVHVTLFTFEVFIDSFSKSIQRNDRTALETGYISRSKS